MKLAVSVLLLFIGIISTGSAVPESSIPAQCKGRIDDRDDCKRGGLGYRYDAGKERCEMYNFKCETTGNNFRTMEQCKETCKAVIRDPCQKNKYEGIACPYWEKPREVFWFNPAAQRCEPFLFLGCNANGNNFEGPKECWDTCKKHVKDPCKFPFSSGDFCGNDAKYATRKTVFGYNPASERCEQYTYYGCGGYPNRFDTAENCWKKCGGNSKCVQSKDGASGAYNRYYYDLTSNTCKSRWYISSGIYQLNRFYSLEDCQHACIANYTHIALYI